MPGVTGVVTKLRVRAARRKSERRQAALSRLFGAAHWRQSTVDRPAATVDRFAVLRPAGILRNSRRGRSLIRVAPTCALLARLGSGPAERNAPAPHRSTDSRRVDHEIPCVRRRGGGTVCGRRFRDGRAGRRLQRPHRVLQLPHRSTGTARGHLLDEPRRDRPATAHRQPARRRAERLVAGRA